MTSPPPMRALNPKGPKMGALSARQGWSMAAVGVRPWFARRGEEGRSRKLSQGREGGFLSGWRSWLMRDLIWSSRPEGDGLGQMSLWPGGDYYCIAADSQQRPTRTAPYSGLRTMVCRWCWCWSLCGGSGSDSHWRHVAAPKQPNHAAAPLNLAALQLTSPTARAVLRQPPHSAACHTSQSA